MTSNRIFYPAIIAIVFFSSGGVRAEGTSMFQFLSSSQAIGAAASAPSAPSVQSSTLPPGNQQNIFIFAYPGTECPGGSERYDIPEQADAQKSGAVFCRYLRRVLPIKKARFQGNCPPSLSPYSDPNGAKPDAADVWCQAPNMPPAALPKSK